MDAPPDPHPAVQAVRDRLAVIEQVDLGSDTDRGYRALFALRDALLTVLDHHVPRPSTPIEAVDLPVADRVKHVCGTCAPSAGLIGNRKVYPCPTVRGIMGMIGARVPGD